VEPYLSVSEEEEDEDDLEDVQLVMKKLAYMKRVCLLECGCEQCGVGRVVWAGWCEQGGVGFSLTVSIS
jgi:hypothetical protein